MSDIIIYPINENLDGDKNISNEKKCFGIDLGTTTTLMCYVDSKYVDLKKDTNLPIQFIKVKQQSPFEFDQTIESEKVASIVAIYNGNPYVGQNLNHLKGHAGFEYKKNLFYHWKLELGIDHHPMYPNAISEKLNMPYKIAGGILNYIRKSRFQNTPLGNTIITVPASFQANQRKDVLRAAEMAKIETAKNMLIDEPNAAFLGYFNRLPTEEKVEWAKKVKNKNVLVVDFGGGTLDLSILNVDFKKEKGIIISNRAISRYNDLGGKDIDTLIAEEFLVPKLKKILENFEATDSIDIKNIILAQLALIGEGLKIGLSNKLSLKSVDKDVSTIDIENVSYTHVNSVITYKKTQYDLGDVTITANEFKNLFIKLFRGKTYSFKYFDKTVTTISSSISDIIEKSELGLDEVDYVLYVGGSSFNPFLQSFCSEKLSNSKALTSHEPDKLVAEGAAVYSYFLNMHNISLISPITSDTIGVVLKDNRFFPILERGQSLPQKISIPDFRLQSNLNQKIVLPVCINSVYFPIGEIRSTLNSFYDMDSVVRIDAEVTIDKVFKMKVYVNDDIIGNAEFDNPYGVGKLTEEERLVYDLKKELNQAKLAKNFKGEKELLKNLIWKYSDVKNYHGVVETSEEYLKRFDDQDESVLNMLYIGNRKIGRKEAAKKALKKGVDLNPEAAYLQYNYSIFLSDNDDDDEALIHLESLDDNIKKDMDITCRILILKNNLGEDVQEEALLLVHKYKESPQDFTGFGKKNLLKSIFNIVGEPYAYVSPKKLRKNEDQKNYLDTNNLPF
ncbi:Hsp70 family protein [Tenacibaculum finnmarkense]|uniref:Hsp70 family protein n=1 Tax=Tenacibaculum finnmarkense TaxID=2781243 RepID=UPI001E28CFC2|nr:Hsp70 family protein [Tenacibaculum finnmarkense]MCD8423223.1 Hsp70 family protein [Tenacibaculum finnmarkense genomovar ulcerans]MCG8239506.1 Hsp70 family protein [Tenacibaculum finnmarkense genomovar ulcerans]